MTTTLEIINGLAQAAANAYDGALDADGEPLEIGLNREKGNPIIDKRVMDGFSVKFHGPLLCIHYHSEVNIKDVDGNKFEGELEQMIEDIAKFLKKEYKRITGNTLSLTKQGELKAHMEYISRIRCWVTARCLYKIGGLTDVPEPRPESEDNLEKKFKDFLNQETDKRPQNDSAKDEEPPTFMSWNLKR
tara:strand:- start:2926 stop:3492 length:567 start_codon:yes stop_codon:yes gene_type:complete